MKPGKYGPWWVVEKSGLYEIWKVNTTGDGKKPKTCVAVMMTADRCKEFLRVNGGLPQGSGRSDRLKF